MPNIWNVLKSSYVWRDKEGIVIADASSPVAGPVLDTFVSPIKAWKMGEGGVLSLLYHMPHDWVVGSDIYFHPHWGHNGTALPETTPAGDIGWLVDGVYANRQKSGGSIEAFTAGSQLAIDITGTSYTIAAYPQNCHIVSEVLLATSGGAGAMFDADNLSVDGIIMLSLELDDEPSVTGGDHFVFTADLHYKGRAYGTKNKDPNASYGYDY